MEPEMTPIQYRLAHALARHFGHTWALANIAGVSRTPTAIREAVLAQFPDAKGVIAPEYDEDLIEDQIVVTHTTASGRLMWMIDPDPEGIVWIAVHRPDRACVIRSKVRVRWPSFYCEEVQWEHIHPRHVHALAEAWFAIADGMRIDPVFRKQIEQTVDDMLDQVIT